MRRESTSRRGLGSRLPLLIDLTNSITFVGGLFFSYKLSITSTGEGAFLPGCLPARR